MARKQFLTPPSTPEELTCRTLKMPSSGPWLGVFNSALLTMNEAWRWEQVNDTDLTIDEALEVVRSVLGEYFFQSECEQCLQPNGLRFIRLSLTGHFEEFNDGVWQEPSGDYEIPPVPAREDGTPEDQLCLAAANAANCLKVLYEDLADSWGSHLSTADAIEKFLVAVAVLLIAPIALAIAGLIAILALAFQVVYETLEFIGADVWTEDFNDRLKCIFLDCATNAAGVVTFDLDCILEQLAAQTPVDPPLFYDLRLFGQIAFMLQWIGTDGLNFAGTSTAIDDPDCSACLDNWCYVWANSTEFESYWTPHPSNDAATSLWSTIFSATVTAVKFLYVIESGAGGTSASAIWKASNYTDLVVLNTPLVGGFNNVLWEPVEPTAVTGVSGGMNTQSGGSGIVYGAEIHGTGTMPAFTGGNVC